MSRIAVTFCPTRDRPVVTEEAEILVVATITTLPEHDCLTGTMSFQAYCLQRAGLTLRQMLNRIMSGVISLTVEAERVEDTALWNVTEILGLSYLGCSVPGSPFRTRDVEAGSRPSCDFYVERTASADHVLVSYDLPLDLAAFTATLPSDMRLADGIIATDRTIGFVEQDRGDRLIVQVECVVTGARGYIVDSSVDAERLHIHMLRLGAVPVEPAADETSFVPFRLAA